MATSNKIERAYTSQDIKTLECAMISKLKEADIQSAVHQWLRYAENNVNTGCLRKNALPWIS